eukprot:7095970-Alexandrium_andersonii.AAC.1
MGPALCSGPLAVCRCGGGRRPRGYPPPSATSWAWTRAVVHRRMRHGARALTGVVSAPRLVTRGTRCGVQRGALSAAGHSPHVALWTVAAAVAAAAACGGARSLRYCSGAGTRWGSSFPASSLI